MLKRWFRVGTGQARKTNHMTTGLGLALSHLISAQLLGKAGQLETEFNHVANDIINMAR